MQLLCFFGSDKIQLSSSHRTIPSANGKGHIIKVVICMMVGKKKTFVTVFKGIPFFTRPAVQLWPTSTKKFLSLNWTKVAGPIRWGVMAGLPVPKVVTLKPLLGFRRFLLCSGFFGGSAASNWVALTIVAAPIAPTVFLINSLLVRFCSLIFSPPVSTNKLKSLPLRCEVASIPDRVLMT